MAQLLVRDLPADLVRRLKQRAAAHGRSAEAEHRDILRRALEPRPTNATLKELLLAMPELPEVPRRRDRARKVRL